MKYRVANRFRFLVFVVCCLIIITCLVNFALGLNVAASATQTEYMQVEVTSGDTLWALAEKYMSDQNDTRRAVYDLCQINDIKASDLQAGMVLMVPTK